MLLFMLLLPLLLLASVGWLLARLPLIRSDWVDGTGELTTKFLIPCLLFNGIYRNGLPQDSSLLVLLAFYIPMVSIFLLSIYFAADLDRSTPLWFAAIYSNTVFVGIPVVIQVLGDPGLRYVFPVIAFHGLIAFSMYYLADSWTGGGLIQLVHPIGSVVRNPIVISLMAGYKF